MPAPTDESDDAVCECELPGFYCSGIPGILAHPEPDGRIAPDAGVERCDLCERYASDSAAAARLRELGLFHPDDPRAG